MFAVTIDQKRSRSGSDLVPELLDAFADLSVVLDFERTAGDELQGLLEDPVAVVAAVLAAMRQGGWSIGVGIGEVRLPLPASTRAAAGPAFIAARAALNNAKRSGSNATVSIVAAEQNRQPWADQAEGVLGLLGQLVLQRTEAEWRVVDAFAESPQATMSEVAATLGISHQAVSQTLSRTSWRQQQAAEPAAATLLTLVEQGTLTVADEPTQN
ncbi:MarR family transcriptional regulator [Acaricomes phytoseiuli]|uniref:MarR family transcriptional regulator n=1 Tax=Acaricomes phytoseiuli TaxID=291968 RepID=UPI0003773DDA|nr:helix-turn-helix domain-containing protein [Acaricomes phytoseiuli]MCW1249816.1 MarR family transcriptional regulator [Acaricomes phytoseiuli]